MRLGQVTEVDMRNMTMSKKLTITLCWQIMASSLFFWFIANLENFGSGIPDAWSVILRFSLIATFYLTKTENRTKHSFLSLILLWVEVLFLSKNAILQKSADLSKI